MSSLVKYKLIDVAKDFGMPSKEIVSIMAEHFEKPRSSQIVLSDEQLNVIFDAVTQSHQIASIEQVFASAEPATPEPAEAAPAAPAETPAASAEEPQADPSPAEQPQGTPPQAAKPQTAKSQDGKQPSQDASKPQGSRAQGSGSRENRDSRTGKSGQDRPQQGQSGSQGRTQNGQGRDNRPQGQGRDANRSAQGGQGRSQQQGQTGSQPRENRENRENRDNRENRENRDNRPAQAASRPQNQPAKQQPQAQTQAQTQAQQPRKKERRVVDTSAVTVNTARFDDHADDLVDEKLQNAQGGKQRINSNKTNKNSKKKTAYVGSKSRNEEQEKMRRLQLEIAKKAPVTVHIPEEISVGELASRMKKTGADVVKQLIKLGVMASISQVIDYDTAAIVAEEMGCKVEREVTVTIEERLIDDHTDTAEELESRQPVVVVMGHVDHGKTSLLDAVRKTNVVSGEAGGITQHIGAYTVKLGDQPITFLDTPGHEAFTAMRARGAMCTDVAILVVAADDGIMPQTVEAINHAKAANIPIIVAVNKMDKPGANPDKIKQQIMEYELIPEEYGGDTPICPISAKTGMGIPDLLEMVLLTAEMQELKANPNRQAKGVVLEARLDRSRGPVATLLVQNGTLHQGDVLIAGTAVGRVRVMNDDKGRSVKTAGPAIPVEITGLSEVPNAGDIFNAVDDERMARQLVEERKEKEKESSSTPVGKVTLEDLFNQIKEGSMKDLNLIVKADVQGSAEAVKQSLLKLSNDEVRVKVIHASVGAISESDVLLASTSGAIIVGFNVRADSAAATHAQRDKVDIRYYRVIYDCINEIEAALKGMLAPVFKEVITGHAEVRQLYRASAIGTIAGCYVKDGKIERNSKIRVLRDNIVVHEGELGSLQRFKDSVREVAAGYECGIVLEKFNDIKEGDMFECFVMEQIKV